VATDAKLELHHQGGGPKHRIDVAIALMDHGNFGVAAGREFARLGFGGEQDRQFLDLQHDEIGRVFRHIGILGEDGDDRIPDITHLVGGENRLPVRLERGNPSLAKIDRRDVRNVGRRPDRDDPGQGARGRGVDRGDPAMGVVRADDPHVELVRK
jgi:hypothetical protein